MYLPYLTNVNYSVTENVEHENERITNSTAPRILIFSLLCSMYIFGQNYVPLLHYWMHQNVIDSIQISSVTAKKTRDSQLACV